MANLKKNSSWLQPAFGDEPTKKLPRRKQNISLEGTSNRLQVSRSYDIIPKKKNTNSLSALFQACEPKNSSELVISRQKRQEISGWLQCRVKRGRPAALILSGPSGCGKSTAIKVLAKENGFSITEWITPMDQVVDEYNNIMRQGDRFEEFLIRATRYTSILSSYSSRLLLVKDFPNVYFRDKESFFSLLEKYFEMGKEPIVFICGDTTNSKMLQTLFPNNIRERFGIDSINLNAVTQAAMKNALKRIATVLNSTAGYMLHVSQQQVDEVLSNHLGDIRNVVLNLIFISLKVPGEQEGKCNSREENLGLLHGIGRIINPKRIQTENGWRFAHNPDDIAAYFESQATIFLNFLQENYLNTLKGIQEANDCADILSVADVLNAEWRDPNLTKLTLSLCVRGMMVINETPVSGWNPVRKPRNEQTEMRRCLATAETRWYETLIKSKSKGVMESSAIDIDGIIE
ncbi:cell cycle checkpoint protein RAD17 [Ceratina calcarata]|uniref:Cell cycle checkpoint protein RAD17 n=1 Tax=Ceratina calcarata TaxID=156304 RepID=A0AAJ7NEY0_9HYME|nr:cell cycle checkpoint protein RAD17 [Ceratina calcarata]